MIIYDSGLLKLNYDPSTDILSVGLPSVDNILQSEVRRSYDIIIEHARNYDIKKLLVDARETMVDVEENVFSRILSDFASNLASTRIQKIARVVSQSSAREHLVRRTLQEKVHTIQFQSFTELEPAIEWLKL